MAILCNDAELAGKIHNRGWYSWLLGSFVEILPAVWPMEAGQSMYISGGRFCSEAKRATRYGTDHSFKVMLRSR
jgi:hypothetical protein